MATDPIIEAAFGPAPAGIDLKANQAFADGAAVIVCLAIAAVAVALRLWARQLQEISIRLDDYMIFPALAFVAGTAALTIVGGNYGAGKHVWAVTSGELVMIMKLLYAYTNIYAASVASTKISILLFYRRIFSTNMMLFNIRLAIGAFLTVSYPIVIWVTMATACRPTSYFWTRFGGAAEGSCSFVDIDRFFMGLTVINMINDIIVLAIPIPEIMGLHMSAGKKVGVIGIFMLGSFVCVASIVRIWAFSQYIAHTDVTWYMGTIFIWSSVEPSVGILSACLPNLRPLLRPAKINLGSSHDDKGGVNASQGGTGNSVWSHSGLGRRSGNGQAGNDSYFRFEGDENSLGASDEVALTRIGRGAVDNETIPHWCNKIMVKNEIVQTSGKELIAS